MKHRYIAIILLSFVILSIYPSAESKDSSSEDPHANCDLTKEKRAQLSKKNVFWRESLREKHNKHHKIAEEHKEQKSRNDTEIVSVVNEEDSTLNQQSAESIEMSKKHRENKHPKKDVGVSGNEILVDNINAADSAEETNQVETENLRRTHNHRHEDEDNLADDAQNTPSEENSIAQGQNLRRTHHHKEDEENTEESVEDAADSENETVDSNEHTESLRRIHKHSDHHVSEHKEEENVDSDIPVTNETPSEDSSNEEQPQSLRRTHHNHEDEEEEGNDIEGVDQSSQIGDDGIQKSQAPAEPQNSVESKKAKIQILKESHHGKNLQNEDPSGHVDADTSVFEPDSINVDNGDTNVDQDSTDSIESLKKLQKKKGVVTKKCDHHKGQNKLSELKKQSVNSVQSMIALKSQNKTDTQEEKSHNKTKEESASLGDAVYKKDENNSETDLNLSRVKVANINNLLQVKCIDSCVDKCRKTYLGKDEEMTNCAIKACKCENADLAVKFIRTDSETTWISAIIDSLIVVSLISLATSIIMIGLIVYKRRQNSNPEKQENQYDSIHLDFSKELCEDKMIDARIFESNYELMTTDIDEEDREICIRDF